METTGWEGRFKERGKRSSAWRRWAAATCVALCAAGAASTAHAQSASPNAVALIIGNADYEHRDVPDVAYAHRDAEAFRRYVVGVLGYAPENVIDLRDATRRQLFDALGTRRDPHSLLWSYLNPEGGSDVVVYFSGHGVPGVNDGRGYLLPVDADPRAAEDDGYPIDLLYENVGGLSEARSVQVYLDACFSGASHEGGLIGNASPVFVQATLPEGVDEKVTSLTAASGKQVASWDEESRHGLFTQHLLDALYGAGDADADGQVTALEAKGYLDRHMTRAARRQYRRIQQASLMGAGHVVLASASQGEAFPARPALDGEEATVVAGATEEAVSPPAESPEAMEEESPEETGGEGSEALENALGLTRAQRVLVQRGLSALEFDAGPADGLFGRRTRAAIAGYQKAKEFAQTGFLNAAQAEALAALGEEVAQRIQEEAVEGKGVGDEFRDCPECPQMVVVPSGSYRMGSSSHEEGRNDDEGPVHEVRIGEPFAVGVYEVTFSEWDACVSGGGCRGHRPSDSGWGRGNRPVINVSWEDAQFYVNWLSGRTGEEYRLLSESEWEYVARAGSTTPFHYGATISTDQANYDGNFPYGSGRKGRYREKTVPVGGFGSNRFGLHDVHGNAWEWVQDCWNDGYHGAPRDGSAWERGDCSKRVLRGGSWNYFARNLRSANRYWNSTGNRFSSGGFRIARALTP